MDKEKFDKLQEAILNNQREFEAQKSPISWQSLTPKDKLNKWKSITTDEFDALLDDQKLELLKEWNELVDLDSEGGEEKVTNLEELRAKFKQTKQPSLQELREAAARARGESKT